MTTLLRNLRIPMRDGVELSADVHFPEGGPEAGPYPVIVHRTPYAPGSSVALQHLDQARDFASYGYAVVINDVRGRHDSDGVWEPFLNERDDGYDTVEWAAVQPWSNGRIGTYGGSYGAIVQWEAARAKPPHLVTMVSSVAIGKWMREIPFNHGIPLLMMFEWNALVGGRTMQDATVVDWERVVAHLPLRTMDEAIAADLPAWREWLSHPRLDDYWKRLLMEERDFAAISLPVLHLTGWYDGARLGTLYLYEGMVRHSPARDHQALVVGPWDHLGAGVASRSLGDVDFGEPASVDINALHRRWFDQWLKTDEDIEHKQSAERIALFVTGRSAWTQPRTWPPERSELMLYLDDTSPPHPGRGVLDATHPENASEQSFVYDPDEASIGLDANFYAPTAPFSLDRQRIEERPDGITYTSDAFDEDLAVIGYPKLILFAASDCLDTDWFATLTEARPDGRSILLSEGMLRARFREGLDQEVLLEPNRVYRLDITIGPVGHLFAKGSRVRLRLASSNFPWYARNQNTGNPIADDIEVRIARNTVSHGGDRASALILPVVRADADRPLSSPLSHVEGQR